MPAPRKGWAELSPAYRARLERQGVTRQSYGRGTDIREARGHRNEGAPRLSPERRELVARAVRADATEAELRAMGRWGRPVWLPRRVKVRPETAAALSQLPSPDKWRSVDFESAGDGQPWRMVVHVKRARYPIVIEIPGGGSQGTGAREALDAIYAVREDLIDVAEQSGREAQARAVFAEPTVVGTP
jgi:hypothetical protein